MRVCQNGLIWVPAQPFTTSFLAALSGSEDFLTRKSHYLCMTPGFAHHARGLLSLERRLLAACKQLPDVLPTCNPSGISMCGTRGEHGVFEDKLLDFRLLNSVFAGIHPAAMHQQKLIFWGRKRDVAMNRGKGLSGLFFKFIILVAHNLSQVHLHTTQMCG